MIGSRFEELSERLAEALESPDPAARIASFGDPDLVELFAWHQRAGSFLEEGRPQRENPWLGRQVGGRYRLKSVLGRGGSGVVYEACDEQVERRRVVVKLLHDFWSSEDWMRRRFREEASVLTRLDHPGIVSLIDAGEIEDGRLFLVLPFHEGRTLRDALAAGPLDAAFAARLLREIGEAVWLRACPGCRASRPQAREHPARPARRWRAPAPDRLRHRPGRRPGGPAPDHDPFDGQRVLHGAGTPLGQGRSRERRLFARRDRVGDAHRSPPVRFGVSVCAARAAAEGRGRCVLPAAAGPGDRGGPAAHARVGLRRGAPCGAGHRLHRGARGQAPGGRAGLAARPALGPAPLAALHAGERGDGARGGGRRRMVAAGLADTARPGRARHRFPRGRRGRDGRVQHSSRADGARHTRLPWRRRQRDAIYLAGSRAAVQEADAAAEGMGLPSRLEGYRRSAGRSLDPPVSRSKPASLRAASTRASRRRQTASSSSPPSRFAPAGMEFTRR